MILKSILTASIFLFVLSVSSSTEIRILTYESMLGKGSLGALLLERGLSSNTEFSCPKCTFKFVQTSDLSGLLGKLRQDKRKKKSLNYDAVLGLDERVYHVAIEEKLIHKGMAFDQSPFAIIVDTQKFKPSNWPKKWSELPQKMAGQLLVQDPRLSSPGLGWLRAIYEHTLVSHTDAKKIVKRVFPSWSSAYAAFLAGEGSAVWSYQTSEAYHRCHDKAEKQGRYRALPLLEGYPMQIEYYARAGVANLSANKDHALKAFETLLLSEDVQKKIISTQWMLPVQNNLPLPDCATGLSAIRGVDSKGTINVQLLQTWLDDWAR